MASLCSPAFNFSQADFGATLQQFEWLNSYQSTTIGEFLVIPVSKKGGLCMHVTLPPMQMDSLDKCFNAFRYFSNQSAAA